MFRAIREFFGRTCKDCEYYSWHREEDRLLPNKKVIEGKMVCESCEKMGCRLNDLKPCKMFRDRSRTHNSFHAYMVHIGQPWPPPPPKGSSNIKRPD